VPSACSAALALAAHIGVHRLAATTSAKAVLCVIR